MQIFYVFADTGSSTRTKEENCNKANCLNEASFGKLACYCTIQRLLIVVKQSVGHA